MRQMADLTERERQVARLVAQGLRNEEIAARLGITHSTVKGHIMAIFDRTGVSNRVELALWVRDEDAE